MFRWRHKGLTWIKSLPPCPLFVSLEYAPSATSLPVDHEAKNMELMKKNNHLVFLTYQKKSTLPFKFTPQGRNMNKWFILYDIRRQQRYLETRFANQKPALAASERAFSLQLSSALSSSSHMVLDRCLSAQKAPDLNIFGKWGGWATFLCKEPFPPHQLGGAFDISSLPSPWKCCTCNHPSPWDCNQCNVLYANTLEVWNILEASDLTLLKIFIFHSSIDGLAKRASTLFLNNGIMLCNMSQALFALT